MSLICSNFNTEIGLYDPHSILSFSTLWITYITAVLQDGGILASVKVILLRRLGINSNQNALYYSNGKPSGSGDLFALSLKMFSSVSVTAAVFPLIEQAG